ncbi:MAG: UDP-N-acetylglucosamine 2-epimerase (non-hydrolyzing) [Methanomicrobiaceae archaeon]|nr:UDP-N-acetylglucosamine 2-epimerase (non-hydrolyzing) [Methanomicrobiaceae archaeon]
MISLVLGTRPEIIKMSPVIRECIRRGTEFSLVHSGQHYSANMDEIFFRQLELPEPDFNLRVGSGKQSEQTAKIMMGMESLFDENRPDAVLVLGDTNTVFAAAYAASKEGIAVGHIEAGLRSYFRGMPEEINRILTDHCSDYLFAPTEKAEKILLSEGIEPEKIFMTGNTIVDAVSENIEISESSMNVMDELGLERGGYLLVTAHRMENVDSRERFSSIIASIHELGRIYSIPVIYPIHPRAKKMLEEFSIDTPGIRFLEPQDYLTFLQLEKNAKLVLTDSGGLQEESCILRVPCVTLRDNTERPETIDVGANILGGTKKEDILAAAEKMINRERNWENPFGDGDASKKILDIIS